MIRNNLQKFAAFAFVAALSGCGAFPVGGTQTHTIDNKGDSAQSLGSFEAIKTDIFDAKCAQCHTGSKGAGAVDLSSYAAIMAAGNLAVAGQPNSSRIYTEVSTGDMPVSGAPLSTAETEAIRDWILAGAPDGSFSTSNPPPVATPAPPTPTPTPKPSPPPSPTPVPQPTPVPTTMISYSEIQTKLFNQSCTGCHSGSRPSSGVDLSSYTKLMANSKVVVAAGSGSTSRVYTEIKSGNMPPSGSVSAQLLKDLKAWIDEGAKNN